MVVRGWCCVVLCVVLDVYLGVVCNWLAFWYIAVGGLLLFGVRCLLLVVVCCLLMFLVIHCSLCVVGCLM